MHRFSGMHVCDNDAVARDTSREQMQVSLQGVTWNSDAGYIDPLQSSKRSTALSQIKLNYVIDRFHFLVCVRVSLSNLGAAR
jgi:hypothetical protein